MEFYNAESQDPIARKRLNWFADKKHFELQSKCRELRVPNLFYVKAVCNDKRDYVSFKTNIDQCPPLAGAGYLF